MNTTNRQTQKNQRQQAQQVQGSKKQTQTRNRPHGEPKHEQELIETRMFR
jgi:hypothetical protein